MYLFSNKYALFLFLDVQNSGKQKVCIDLIMLRLHKYTYGVYTKESLVYTQEISCACTTLLCMLWAREPWGQGPKRAPPGPRTGPSALFGPWPLGSLAQSMHKSAVHAQEISCVYTRDSFVYTQEIFCEYTREGT